MPKRLISLLLVLCSPADTLAQQQLAAPTAAAAAEAPLPEPGPLALARSWAYQLQHAKAAQIAASPFDVVVIDYSRNGTDEKRFKPADLKRMKKKPGGGRRIVLAYLSVGEAEDYRFYWDEKWVETATPEEAAAPADAAASTAGPAPPAAAPPQDTPAPAASGKPDRWISEHAPSWLGDENEQWSGNFEVKYWDKAWQDIVFGTPESYLEKIIAAGFDGVYLDRVDAFYEFQDMRETATDEMVDLVVRLAAHARRLKPGFLVVPQNGEELLLKPDYLASIDGIAKEDLFFGGPGEGEVNHPAVVANSLAWLGQTETRKLPVLVIEYLDKPEQIVEARALIEARGFIPYFGVRALDRLVLPAAPAASPKAATETPGRSPAKQKSGRNR